MGDVAGAVGGRRGQGNIAGVGGLVRRNAVGIGVQGIADTLDYTASIHVTFKHDVATGNRYEALRHILVVICGGNHTDRRRGVHFDAGIAGAVQVADNLVQYAATEPRPVSLNLSHIEVTGLENFHTRQCIS